MRRLYTVLLWIALPLVTLVVAWRGLRDRQYWRGWRERFGLGASGASTGAVWIHAVSVGEVQAAEPLIRALQVRAAQRAIVLTVATPAGRARAQALLGPAVAVRYAPYDLPPCLRAALRRIRPAACVVFETELWPNLYHQCHRAGVPMLLASARVSARSARLFLRFPGLMRAALRANVTVAAQSAADAQRYAAMGVAPERLHVAGNIKFDRELPEGVQRRGAALRSGYAATRPVWVAGSTHAPEEAAALAAQSALRAQHIDALLVLAPRHRPRFEEVAALLAARGERFVRRSAAQRDPEARVLLLDTIGELLDFYAAADVAFVGGSLAPVGGHNLIEPAQLGLPVLAGPHQHNAPDIAARLSECGALEIVPDTHALAAALGRLLTDSALRERRGAAAREAVLGGRGALSRLLALLEALLGPAAVERRPD